MAMKTNKLDPQVVEYFLKHTKTASDIFGDTGLLKELKKALTERILEGELTDALGYAKHEVSGHNSGNSRNGHSQKTIKTTDGEMTIEVPRDRNNEFVPQLIPKHQTRFDDLDDKIMSLYARGMTTRDIQDQLKDLYGTTICSSLISTVTNEVIEEVKAWQSRPLDKVYPIVYLDALVIKVQQDKKVINKALYLALGINIDGQKELLGIWISQEVCRDARDRLLASLSIIDSQYATT
ncbi:IS256 family transposase [Candidiatus Paracoxiella cheracis]|uniref:IS256 family transposase n=1 Tax=Candidiatus Paracoxiella cheracis TaxID=3405120 RepID=UPI003BF5E32B